MCGACGERSVDKNDVRMNEETEKAYQLRMVLGESMQKTLTGGTLANVGVGHPRQLRRAHQV